MFLLEQFCLLFSILIGAEKWNTVIIGAGFSGLTMAARLKEIGVSFTIIEKAEEVGGTWWYNIYPGAACDIPSHLYSVSFFPNPNWTKSFSMYVNFSSTLGIFIKSYTTSM